MKKKFTSYFLLFIICFFTFRTTAFAEENADESDIVEITPLEIEDSLSEIPEEPIIEVESNTNRLGWYKDEDGDFFYYKQAGVIQLGWLYNKGKWYYFDSNNQIKNGVMLKDCSMEINGNTYFFNSSGEMLSGWIKRPEGWYYANADGAMTKGWIYLGRKWYYLDGNNQEYPGLMISNDKKVISGHTYFFNTSGEMMTGWVKRPEGWYYANTSGAMTKGWIYLGRKWYYLDGSNQEYPGLMISNSEKQIGNVIYRFNTDGSMVTGWYRKDGKWYYYDSSGALTRGWRYLAGAWYYLNPEDYSMLSSEWKEINGVWYYFLSSGAMAKNWLSWGGNWYYMGSDGGMKTGWHIIDGYWYYMYPAGNSIGAATGTMARSTVIGKYRIASDGRWINGRVTLESVWHTEYIAKWNTNYQLDSSLSARLNSAIAAYTNSGNTVSFVMTDMNTGQVLSYKAGLELYSASCIKGPYVLSVLDAGYSPTASIWNTINWSSNSDYASIRRTYGAGVFQNWLARAGVPRGQGSNNYTTTTSLDLAKMWSYGYDFLTSNKANAPWARSTFQHVLNSASSNSLGNYYAVYSKAGWIANGGYYNVYTDAGIVMAGSYPYVISIMSNCSGTAGMVKTQNLVSVLNSIHSQMVK